MQLMPTLYTTSLPPWLPPYARRLVAAIHAKLALLRLTCRGKGRQQHEHVNISHKACVRQAAPAAYGHVVWPCQRPARQQPPCAGYPREMVRGKTG